jgi:putative membrane protein
MSGRIVPYCGLPPSPAELLTRWNLDPVLIGALAVLWLAYGLWAHRRRLARAWAFHLGWGLTAFLLVCPICPLSVSLFSARIAQHMLLIGAAAPLVALGLPRPGRWDGNALLAAGVFAVALWFWHAPVPYTLTFQSVLAYWLMHLSLYGSALWLWRALLSADGRLGQAVAATALTAAQMGLLSAAITFAGRPLYPPHFLTTAPWGLTPLADQQLGGAIMWAPAGAVSVAVLMWSLASLFRRAGRPAAVEGL